MISKKRFHELIEYVKKKNHEAVNRYIDESMETFDFELFKEAYEIIKNKENYTDQQWINLYEKYKDNYNMLLVILKHCDKNPILDNGHSVYYEILDKCVDLNGKNGDTVFHNPPRPDVKDYYLKDITTECLKRDITLEEMYKLLMVKPLSELISDHYNINDPAKKKSEISCKNTNTIAYLSALECKNEMNNKLKLLDEKIKKAKLDGTELSLGDKIVSTTSICEFERKLMPICYVEDIEYLNTLLDDFENTSISELVANCIIKNICLDYEKPEVKELLQRATEYCDIGLLNDNIPECIAPEISIIAYDTLIEFLSEDCIAPYELTEHPKTKMPVYPSRLLFLIENLCESETINDGVLTDLAHRIAKADIKTYNHFAISVFSNVSNPDLIPLIDNLHETNKAVVYENNKYIPEEMLINRAEEICDKIDDIIKKGLDEDRSISPSWYSYIKSAAEKTTLSDKCYDTMLKLLDFSTESYAASGILILSNTPAHISDKIIDFCNRNLNDENDSLNNSLYFSKIKASAKINKLYNDNKLNKKATLALCSASKSKYFSYRENYDIKFENCNSENDPLMLGVKYLHRELDNEQEVLNVVNCLREHINNGYFEKQEKIFFGKISDIIETNLKIYKLIKEDDITDLTKLNKCAIGAKQYVLDYAIYSYFPQLVDEFNEYYELCLKENEEKNKKRNDISQDIER